MANTFRINNRAERKQQTFDKEKINIVKAGKKINVYDFIQAGKEDTEIYPTLEKYGCLDRLKLDAEQTYGDIRAVKDLRNSLDQINAAKEIWINLPLETRREFNHSVKEFIEKGETWAKNKVEDLKKAEEAKKVIDTKIPIKDAPIAE